MNQTYRLLAERIRGEIPELELVANRTLRSWKQAQLTALDQDIYLDSVALNLHGFYSGLEKIFELVARNIDDVDLEGQTWHRDLLLSMSREYEDVRPALISIEHVQSLDEFRRFRHLIRNIYTTNIQPEKMRHLLDTLPELWQGMKGELFAFAAFLDQTAGL